MAQKRVILGPKWGSAEISVAENGGCGGGVAEKFSARTENIPKCSQIFFCGAGHIFGFFSPENVKKLVNLACQYVNVRVRGDVRGMIHILKVC